MYRLLVALSSEELLCHGQRDLKLLICKCKRTLKTFLKAVKHLASFCGKELNSAQALSLL